VAQALLMHFMFDCMPPIPVRSAPKTQAVLGCATSLRFGDIDEQAAALQGWNQRYLQLSRGRFEGSVQRLQLGGLGLFVEDLHQSVYQAGWVRNDVFAIGVPLMVQGDAQFCGQRATSNSLHVFSGQQGFEFLSPQRHVMIGIELDSALHEAHLMPTSSETSLGWQATHAGLLQPDAAVLGKLRSFLMALFQSLSQAGAAAGAARSDLAHSAVLRHQVRAQLIDHIAAALVQQDTGAQEQGGMPTKAQLALVDRAAEFVSARLSEAPSVGEICGTLGVSRRTLQSAFHARWGMGPLAWLILMRLNAVRRRLKSAAHVTEAATEFGFWHFGHFAGQYQSLFGECPSQTLRRHRQISEH
jgi:AraC family ethanolamine operon transcriptional activator